MRTRKYIQKLRENIPSPRELESLRLSDRWLGNNYPFTPGPELYWGTMFEFRKKDGSQDGGLFTPTNIMTISLSSLFTGGQLFNGKTQTLRALDAISREYAEQEVAVKLMVGREMYDALKPLSIPKVSYEFFELEDVLRELNL